MTARHLFARQPQGSITVSQPFHPNAIRQNIRATTQPNNSRETGMTALYALGCLAVVVATLIVICV
jgi:hypothetical protein